MTDGEIMKDTGAVANQKVQTAIREYGRKEREESMKNGMEKRLVVRYLRNMSVLHLTDVT